MGGSPYGNALTEVALALAMAFFSIMVLAMVSMGAGTARDTSRAAKVEAVTAPLSPAIPTTEEKARDGGAKDDTVVIFWAGHFFDRDLNPFDPAAGAFPGRVILALSPDISVADAMNARGRLATQDLVVSTLDDKWLATLRQRTAKEN